MLTLIENTTQQKESDLELYQAKVRENVKLICETLTRAFFGDYTVQVQSPEYLGELHILGMLVNSLINAYRNSTSREVKSHNEYIQALIRSLGEGLCGIDQDGRLIYINPAGEKILGWTSSELIGRHIDQTIHGHERDSSIGGSETCEILRVLKTLTAHAVEEDIFFRKDKTPIPVTYTVTPILQEGRVTGLNLAFQDITERKRIAEALKEKSAELERSNKELDEFAYIAAHDLKEPLRGIQNYATFLLEDYGDKFGTEVHSKLETMKSLSNHMGRLIESLLHYSRVGWVDLAVEEVDLNESLKEVLDSLDFSLKERNIILRIPRPLPKVYCDRARVGEVFSNLISNASKYNDKPDKWIEIGFEEHMDHGYRLPTVFFVRDNGIGIQEKHIESIFRIFKRLHVRNEFGGGAGAGLTIVKKIVERHGGWIRVESQYGQGTTFYFTLEKDGGS